MLPQLRRSVWSEISPVPCELVWTGPERKAWAEVSGKRGKRMAGPQHWGKVFDYAWFRLEIPAATGTVYLNWRDQGEATLYVHGEPYYGMDAAHRHAELPRGIKEAWVEGTCAQGAIWHPDAKGLDAEGSRWDGCSLMRRDDDAWHATIDFEVMLDLAKVMLTGARPARGNPFAAIGYQAPWEEANPLARIILEGLDQALNAFGTGGFPAMRRRLEFIMRELPAHATEVKAAVTGHCHIDLVWLWPERIGETKAVHSFATADYLMDRYPELRFGYSQPASYEAVETLAPGLFKRVKKRIKQGKWDAYGATQVESDTLLACGEALLRSFDLGQRWFEKHTGARSEICWLPDCFGFSACLPQLMSGYGVKYFFTTKQLWRTLEMFPYTSFVWRGLDGSEVIAHVTRNGYNNNAMPAELRQAADQHLQSAVHREFLYCAGYGDGGGGPTEHMCERMRRLQSLAGVPKASWDNVPAFFKRLNALKPELPVWNGEISIQYHRGIASTHGSLKHQFRAVEKALQAWEAVRCAFGGMPIPEEPWKRIVFAQFHDFIPGSSINDVYVESNEEHPKIATQAMQAAADELAKGAPGNEACLFNPTGYTIRVPVASDDSRAARVQELPPLSGSIRGAGLQDVSAVEASTRSLSNGLVTVAFNARGQLSRFDVHGHEVCLAEPAAAVSLHVDQPSIFPSWDIEASAFEMAVEPKKLAAVSRVAENSAVRGAVEFRHQLTSASSMVVRYVLEAGSPVLQIECDVDWQDGQHLLKLVFPTRYRGRMARFGAAFGSVQRPQIMAGLADEANWEVAGSRWAAVGDDGDHEGLFVVTEAKYGFSCRDGKLGVTLVRSPLVTGEVHEGHGGGVPKSNRRIVRPTPYADIGRHHIRLAVGRYDGGASREHFPTALAETLYAPVLAYKGRPMASPFTGLQGGESLHPAWARPVAKNRWHLRLHEVRGCAGRADLLLADGWVGRRAAMDGKSLAGARPLKAIDFAPYEIVTIELANR
jgi:alpha-mannosidase